MRNYKWVINRLICVPKEDQMIDVVSIVFWSRTVQTKDLIEASISDTLSCGKPSEENFIPYNELTYEEICKWLDSNLDSVELDKQLDIKIENILNPSVITLPLPWNDEILSNIIDEKDVILEPKTI
jgi:hypothetical protein